jgi:hypothetical protein
MLLALAWEVRRDARHARPAPTASRPGTPSPAA